MEKFWTIPEVMLRKQLLTAYFEDKVNSQIRNSVSPVRS